jgi:predicted NACHT family NTPase
MSFPEAFLAELVQARQLSPREQDVFVQLFGAGQSRIAIQQVLNISESNLNSCLSGIYRKFGIASDLGRGKENHLRDYLENQFKIWKGATASASNSTSDAAEVDLNALVQTIRKQIRPQIQETCGTMRVLDMTQPVELGNIYTNVNILERLSRTRGLETVELIRAADLKTFDRFLLGKVQQEQIPGLEAVERFSKLMILGKPGAGKTTFLKHLAIECISGNFRADYVPVFVTLKSFAEADGQPGLLNYLHQLIPQAQTVLDAGKALILLDGLDEVRETDGDRVLRQIRDFARQFWGNQFVITCRIAAHEYTFEQFTEIEIADFNAEQIADFVTKWFACRNDSVKAERFLEKLKQNKPIQELASSPLLLTLLCLVFEDGADFPANRADLYKEGIDVMLKKWDAKRNIERAQIYKKLSLKRKEGLLSHVAYITFSAGNYFFKQRDVERYISEYITNLPGVSNEPEALELDSAAVLKSIEAQHGLFVERARNIYSFSHLTFHEYFTACKITETCNAYADDDPTLQELAEHITEPRYREVFLLTVGMLPNADSLLLPMKQKIDSLVADNQRLQEFLVWVQEKSDSVDASYKPAAIRAFYFDLDFDHALARDLDHALARDLDFDHALARALGFARARARASALDHDLALDLALTRILNLDLDRALDLDLDRALASELKHKLQQLKEKLSDTSWENRRENFKQWWQINGEAWTEQFRAVMIEHRNIGHKWQFSDAQRELLQQYYGANQLLVDCLNLPDIYVSRNVREKIEETLLLPAR